MKRQVRKTSCKLDSEFQRATKSTYMFQEKTFTDSVIGTLCVQKTLFGGQINGQQMMISTGDNYEDNLKYTVYSYSMGGGVAGLNA